MRVTIKAALGIAALAGLAVATAYVLGFAPGSARELIAEKAAKLAGTASPAEPQPPAITVAKVEIVAMTATVLVTGTFVPREEILVAPEVESLRVVSLAVDVGDRVVKGQVLATLERTQLDAQLAQNTASLARADATIAQAKSQIAQAEAAVAEAKSSFDRAKPLKSSGYLSESVYDQREAAARTTAAQLVAARDGLKLAEATKQETEAQRREIEWRLGNTEVKAPRSGLVSRRTARIGALATGASQPMFHIIADGEIELEADIIEADLPSVTAGQPVSIDVAGIGEVQGKVRLVTPEVDRQTRLGKVKIFIGDKPGLRIGAFGRGRIVTAQVRAIAVPAAAVMYGSESASVLRINGDRVEARLITTGLRAAGLIEVKSGLAEGDLVVAKAGTFLRDGDRVRAVLPDPKISEAN